MAIPDGARSDVESRREVQIDLHEHEKHPCRPDRQPEPIPIKYGETVAAEFTKDSVQSRDNSSVLYDVYEFEGRCGDCVTITTRSEAEPWQPRPMLFDPDGRYDGPRYRTDRSYTLGADPTYTGEEFVLSELQLPKTGKYTIWISSYGPAYYDTSCPSSAETDACSRAVSRGGSTARRTAFARDRISDLGQI